MLGCPAHRCRNRPLHRGLQDLRGIHLRADGDFDRPHAAALGAFHIGPSPPRVVVVSRRRCLRLAGDRSRSRWATCSRRQFLVLLFGPDYAAGTPRSESSRRPAHRLRDLDSPCHRHLGGPGTAACCTTGLVGLGGQRRAQPVRDSAVRRQRRRLLYRRGRAGERGNTGIGAPKVVVVVPLISSVPRSTSKKIDAILS